MNLDCSIEKNAHDTYGLTFGERLQAMSFLINYEIGFREIGDHTGIYMPVRGSSSKERAMWDKQMEIDKVNFNVNKVCNPDLRYALSNNLFSTAIGFYNFVESTFRKTKGSDHSYLPKARAIAQFMVTRSMLITEALSRNIDFPFLPGNKDDTEGVIHAFLSVATFEQYKDILKHSPSSGRYIPLCLGKFFVMSYNMHTDNMVFADNHIANMSRELSACAGEVGSYPCNRWVGSGCGEELETLREEFQNMENTFFEICNTRPEKIIIAYNRLVSMCDGAGPAYLADLI